MKKNILISRRTCVLLSIGLIALSIFLPLFFSNSRHSLLVYLSTSVLTAFVCGFLLALVSDRILTSRLKARFPLWRKEIEKHGFASFLRSKSPHSEEIIGKLIRQDPDAAQIIRERQSFRRFSVCWLYIPTAFFVFLILFYAFVQ